jgi:hypothetical protein
LQPRRCLAARQSKPQPRIYFHHHLKDKQPAVLNGAKMLLGMPLHNLQVSTRLWLAGWQVGYFGIATHGDGAEGGLIVTIKPPSCAAFACNTDMGQDSLSEQSVTAALASAATDPAAAGGTHVGDGAHRCWGKQQWLTGFVFGERASMDTHHSILKLVQQANLNLTNMSPQNECPYHKDVCAGLPYSPPDRNRTFGMD